LNKAVNIGVADAKNNTPTLSGYMKKSWSSSPTIKTAKGAEKEMFNSMDYSSFVNYGHRVVNGAGDTVGFVKGKFMLDKAIHKVDKALQKEFGKEVERVNKEHDT